MHHHVGLYVVLLISLCGVNFIILQWSRVQTCAKARNHKNSFKCFMLWDALNCCDANHCDKARNIMSNETICIFYINISKKQIMSNLCPAFLEKNKFRKIIFKHFEMKVEVAAYNQKVSQLILGCLWTQVRHLSNIWNLGLCWSRNQLYSLLHCLCFQTFLFHLKIKEIPSRHLKDIQII